MSKMTQYSIKKLCTIRNLRMQKGEWLIDFTDYSNDKSKTKTLTIGKSLKWRKLSEKIPKATFNKRIKDRLVKEIKGITFAKCKIEN